jgi:hypothetical protein
MIVWDDVVVEERYGMPWTRDTRISVERRLLRKYAHNHGAMHNTRIIVGAGRLRYVEKTLAAERESESERKRRQHGEGGPQGSCPR